MINSMSIMIHEEYINDSYGTYKKFTLNNKVYYKLLHYGRVFGNKFGEFDYITITPNYYRSYHYHRINGPARKCKNTNYLFDLKIMINIDNMVI